MREVQGGSIRSVVLVGVRGGATDRVRECVCTEMKEIGDGCGV